MMPDQILQRTEIPISEEARAFCVRAREFWITSKRRSSWQDSTSQSLASLQSTWNKTRKTANNTWS